MQTPNAFGKSNLLFWCVHDSALQKVLWEFWGADNDGSCETPIHGSLGQGKMPPFRQWLEGSTCSVGETCVCCLGAGLALKRVLPLPKPPHVEGLSFSCSAASRTAHKKSLCVSQDYVVPWSYQVLLCKLQKNVVWCMHQARYLHWKQAFHWLKSLWSDYLRNLSSVFNGGTASLKYWEPEFCWKDKFFFIKKWKWK